MPGENAAADVHTREHEEEAEDETGEATRQRGGLFMITKVSQDVSQDPDDGDGAYGLGLDEEE
jgi:hypothetical protein